MPACDAEISAQKSLKLILEDDSLNLCTTTYKSGTALVHSYMSGTACIA